MKQNSNFNAYRKLYTWFLINYKKILSVIYVIAIVFCVCLAFCLWNNSADDYSDNFIIEITVGICFSVLPLLIGISLGKRVARDLQYYKFRSLLSEIQLLRKGGKIDKKTTQLLVTKVVENLGKGIEQEDWYEKLSKKVESEKVVTCNVCDLNVKTSNKRCDHCKLNIFAWELND